MSPTTPAHLWTTTTRTGAALKVGGAIVAHHAQVNTWNKITFDHFLQTILFFFSNFLGFSGE